MTAAASRNDDPPRRLSANALERRVKRWLASGPFDCFVQVAPGLETLLMQELLELSLATGRESLRPARGGVGLDLDHEGVMRANLELRTAGRVMLRLGTFPASNREMLYDRARKIAWEVQLGYASGYRLRVTAKNSKLQAGDEVNTAMAGAISRRMRAFDLFPKPAEDAPLEFHVRLLDDRCTVSLNTSGEHLHRRGTRTHVHTAPVRETVAAALAITGLSTSPTPPEVIVDPVCGSGTLLLEAADLLAALPPGRHRGFAFEQAAWFRDGRWREVKRRSVAATDAAPAALPRMVGIDKDERALEAARVNLSASDHQAIELVQGDSTLFDYDGLDARTGLVIGNPPYGLRLGDRRAAHDLTRRLLDRLAASSIDWQVALLVQEAGSVTGHPAFELSSTTATTNGGVPVELVVGRVIKRPGLDAA